MLTKTFVVAFLCVLFGASSVSCAQPSEVVAQLQSDDGAVRREAVRSLPALGPEGVALMEQVLQTETDAQIRWTGVRLLPEFGDGALFLAVQALEDPEPSVREAAATVLGTWGSDAAIDPLASALFDGDEGVRLAAVSALGRFGARAEPVFSEMVLLLGDESFRVRRTATTTVSRLVTNDQVVQLLVTQLSDSRAGVPLMAAQALAQQRQLPEAVGPALLPYLSGDDRQILPVVLEVLIAFPEFVQGAAEQIVPHLWDEESSIARQARQVLLSLGEEALPELISVLAGEDKAQQRVVLELLAHMGPAASGAAGPVAALLGDQTLQSASAHALVNMGEGAVPYVLPWLKSSQEPDIRFVLGIIEAMGPAAVDAGAVVAELLRQPTYRAAAVRALLSLGRAQTVQEFFSEQTTLSEAEIEQQLRRSAYPVAVLAQSDFSYKLQGILSRLGFDAVLVTESEIVSGRLLQGRYEAVFLPESPFLSAAVLPALRGFMDQGGDLLFFGGKPFVASEAQFLQFEENPLHVLQGIEGIETYGALDGLPSVQISGRFSGQSAIITNRIGQSSFLPLLCTVDGYGRRTGWAAGMLINFSGLRSGSHWVVFGIEQEEFYLQDALGVYVASLLDLIQSGQLLHQARVEEGQRLERTIESRTPPPQRVRITADGTGFEYEDGTPFFMVGVNAIGPAGFHHWAAWYADELEAMFIRMQQAGINALRLRTPITGIMYRSEEHVQALIELARRYGVYLLIEIGPDPSQATEEIIAERAARAAALFANEPIVLGYDLDNEPYPWDIGSVSFASGETIQQRYPFNYGNYVGWVNPGSFSLFENLDTQMPRPFAGLVENYNNIDQAFGAWIDMYTDILRQADPDALITVGYNNHYIAFPANDRLDFISNHVYPYTWANLRPSRQPANYETIHLGLTTMDRLAAMWPDRPISIGEFGYSDGIINNGDFLDVWTKSVVELVFYLYSLDRGYSGVMKWQLDDWPLDVIIRQRPLVDGDPSQSFERRVIQSRWGLYAYDGTHLGRPKPIAHGLRFLRQFIDAGNFGGHLALRTVVGEQTVAYTYTHDNGLFVGDVAYTSEAVTFHSVNGKPANVMIMVTDGAIRLMSTNDALVVLDPAAFCQSFAEHVVQAEGFFGSFDALDRRVELLLLEGEEVVLTRM